jgi:uncharacterized DUF497 family protein
LAGEPDDFEWDEGNRTKNRKHGVEPHDVEVMFEHPILFAGRIVEPTHEEARWLLLGQHSSGRGLALIFTRRAGRLRPISCRPMRRKERKLYEETLALRNK